MNKHTPGTLSMFRDQQICIDYKDGPNLGVLKYVDEFGVAHIQLLSHGNYVFSGDEPLVERPHARIYPILRPAEDLTAEEIAEVLKCDPKDIDFNLDDCEPGDIVPGVIAVILRESFDIDFFLDGFCEGHPYGTQSSIDISQLTYLLKIGAGAIPNSDSPTGYVDFIHGLPCYTPKMMEKMGL